MISVQDIVKALDIEGAREIILAAGARPAVKLKRGIEFFSPNRVKPDEVKSILLNLKQRSKLVNQPLGTKGHFSVGIPGVGRLQVFYSVQRGSYMIAIKKVKDTPPFLREILLNPLDRDNILSVFHDPTGLILIQSPSENPVYDFVAAILTYLSKYSQFVIQTIEDPIAYILKHDQSLILQTEIGQDIDTPEEGLYVSQFVNPDVLYVSKLTTSTELKELLSIIERGNMVILPVISASLEAALLSLERMSDDEVLLRSTLSFFLRACFTLEEAEKDKIDVKLTLMTPEFKKHIREGNYSNISNG